VTKAADTNDGSCNAERSLREAVIAANASPGADDIALPAGDYLLMIGGAGEDAGATGDLDVTGDLTFTGVGADNTRIDGSGADRVIHVIKSVVEVSGVTVTAS
jgi:CSLREA domain-containing protein